MRQPHRRAQHGPHEHLERHQRAHRVARQRDDRRVADPACALRHSGLHGHLDELDGIRCAAQCVLDHLVGARAHPARGDDQVRVAAVAVQHRTEFVDVVGGHRGGDHLTACLADRRGQHHRVGLVDLPRFQRSARSDQLTTRRHHQYPHPRVHRQLPDAECRSQAQRRGRHHRTRSQHRGARGDVLTRGADVLAGPGRRADLDDLGARVRRLYRHHGRCAGGHRGAGHDAVRGAGRQRQRIGAARRNVLGHRQSHRSGGAGPCDVVGQHGVAVHRRIVEARQ